MSASLFTILLVEDNDDDVFAMQRALRKAQVSHSVQVVNNGQKAIDYLSGTGAYADRNAFPTPSIIFLDLKVPYVDGFEVLEWLRGQAALRNLPVIVLTGSAEESDQNRVAQLGARAYLVKPPEPTELSRLLATLSPGV